MVTRARTPSVRFPSDCRKIVDDELRTRAYRRAVYVTKRWSDTLSARISAHVPLDESDVDGLVQLLGQRCSAQTKDVLRARLRSVSTLPQWSLFERVQLHDRGPEYCAGQDYPREIATVRRLIITGK